MSDARRPAEVYAVGRDPDPRFSLANERTALAWIRTALALVGGGVALISLGSLSGAPRWAAAIGVLGCLGGGVLAMRSVRGWERAERAMRLSQPLPAPRGLYYLGGAVLVLACLTVALGLVEVFTR